MTSSRYQVMALCCNPDCEDRREVVFANEHDHEIFLLNREIDFLRKELARVSAGYQHAMRADLNRDSVFAVELRHAQAQITDLALRNASLKDELTGDDEEDDT